MALRISQHKFSGETVPYEDYDSTKTMLGQLIQQRTGVNPEDNFAGPMPIGVARPMESSTAIASAYPHVIQWDETYDYVFLIENGTAAATRRVIMYTFNKLTSQFNWTGFITLTFPTATSHTVRGFRVIRELYTDGTASVSGTAVTGSGTTWQSSSLAVGTRIGFGSSDPTQITTWYEIASVDSNTGITLTTNAGTIGSGPYVIEDLQVVVSTTNATVTNGGLFLVKGLRYETFAIAGTVIPAATTVDNIRAVYWLADAGVVTNTISCGVALGNRDSWTQQYVYVIDGTTTTNRVYKYNIRAALTVASGKTTSAFDLVTGAQTPTGTCSQANNGRVGTLNHGPGNGVESLYFATTTRVYRAALTNITSGNTTWHSDAMTEMPPGGTTTYALTSALNSVELANTIDRLIIMTSGTAGARSYVSEYNTISNPFNHIFLADDKQQDQSSTDSGAVSHPAIIASIMSVWSEGGIAYICRNGTTAALNQMYSVPLSAHWTYAGGTPNQRLISPSIPTPSAVVFDRVYISSIRYIGSGTFGMQAEPFRVFYRQNGIVDDSGAWTELDDTGNLNGISPSSEIQFMFEFKIMGTTCIPNQIFSVAVAYEDDSTDSHYQPSVGNSNLGTSTFAWRFSTAFGGTVPTLRVRLYDAITGGLLVDDTTDAPDGTFEKSTDDGDTWGAYDTNDKANNITYIRYTPASLGSDIKVRALLTQNV